jgi:hypothetical protein
MYLCACEETRNEQGGVRSLFVEDGRHPDPFVFQKRKDGREKRRPERYKECACVCVWGGEGYIEDSLAVTHDRFNENHSSKNKSLEAIRTYT